MLPKARASDGQNQGRLCGLPERLRAERRVAASRERAAMGQPSVASDTGAPLEQRHGLKQEKNPYAIAQAPNV